MKFLYSNLETFYRVLWFFAIGMISTGMYGQRAFEGAAVNSNLKPEIKEIDSYEIFEIEYGDLNRYLRSGMGSIPFSLKLGDKNLYFEVYKHRARAESVQTLVQQEGQIVLEENSAEWIFRGPYDRDPEQRVIMVADTDLLAMAFSHDGKHYIIEPMWWHIAGAPKNQIILYESSIVKFLEEARCGADDLIINRAKRALPFGFQNTENEKEEDPLHQRSGNPCREVEYGAALDWSFVNKYNGSNGAFNRVNFVMGLVQTQYTDHFNFDFIFTRTAEFASTCSTCDPWSSSNDAGTVLSSFRSWGNSGGFQGQPFDVAGLWTNRVFNGGTVGIAYVGGMCNNSRYHALRDFSSASWAMRVMVSHEIGHNLSYGHDAQGSNFIMAPSVTNTTNWSQPSINTINNFVNGNGGNCLGSCPETCENFAVDYTVTHTSCNLQNGVLRLTITGGQAPYSVNIGNGFVQQTVFSGLAPGLYTVQIKDNSICEETILVEILPSLDINFLVSKVNTSCGENNGIIEINVLQGNPPYLYDIGFGAQSQNAFYNLSPGTYTISVTDAESCLKTSSVVIESSTPLIADVVVVHTSCGNNNGRVTVNAQGGTPPYRYTYNGIYRNSPVFDSLPPGNYRFEVLDFYGCFFSVPAVINGSQGVQATAVSIPAACEGANGSITVTVTQGRSPYTYTLNGVSQQSNIFRNLAPGQYTIMVTDSTGCTRNVNHTVPNQNSLSLSSDVGHAWCEIDQGFISTFPLNGYAPFEFNFGNGFQSENFIENLAAGNYAVSVRDSAGCPGNFNVEILGSPAVTASAEVTSSDCILNNGTVLLIASGGTGPFTYNMGNRSSQNPLFQNVGAGRYFCIIVDSLGCEGVTVAEVESKSGLNVQVDVEDANCGEPDGSATAIASGGNAPYTYDIGSGPQNSGFFPNLLAGFYTLTVLDHGNCSFEDFFIVEGFTPIVLKAETEPTTCGLSNGSAVVEVTGGNGQYSYFLNDVQVNSPQMEDLAGGNYIFRVTDTAGCESSVSFTVEPSSAMSANLLISLTTCENQNGVIEAQVSGGYPPYAFDLGEGPQSANRFLNLSAGNYTLTITDDENCTLIKTIELGNQGLKPISGFTFVRNGRQIRLSNQSSGEPEMYVWNFGDGNSSQEINPRHTYQDLKEYEVCLRASNNCGESLYCQTIQVSGQRDCMPNDSIILAKLYEKLDGENWENQWDSNLLFSDWYGIELDIDRCVLKLDLKGNNLSGEIISELGDLLAVEYIDLSSNQIDGSLPRSWANLDQLNTLILADNNLEGTLPMEWENLSSIRKVDLSRNKFSGELPSVIQYWQNLEYLNLSHNEYTSGFDADWQNLTHLEYLNLSHNQLNGNVPDIWESMPQIKYVYLNNNNFEGVLPASMASLDSLKSLWISHNNLEKIPQFKPEIQWLDEEIGGLRVDNNRLTFTTLIPNSSVFDELIYRSYAPQAKVFKDTTVIISQRNEVILDIEVDKEVSGVQYQWYRNGEIVPGLNSSELILSTLIPELSGVYHCEITHTDLPELTLVSHNITLTILTHTDDWLLEQGLSLYPNPTATNQEYWIKIQNENVSQGLRLEIFNVTGQLLNQYFWNADQNEPLRLTAPNISGVYFIRIVDSKGHSAFKKLVVE